MRRPIRFEWSLALVALLGAPTAAQQAANPPPRVIGGHQIDRYDAIEQVRKALKADPNNLRDWVLLGELAQDTAAEASVNLAPGYYRLARESFDNALKLKPESPGIKAAAAFAREQERRAEEIKASRGRATAGYLAARRRELSQSSYSPTVRVYPSAAPPAPSPAPPSPYYYQPYVGEQGTPYTYQQHYDSFYGPVEPRSSGQAVTATERAGLVKPGARAAPP